jgi:hypothetical protein
MTFEEQMRKVQQAERASEDRASVLMDLFEEAGWSHTPVESVTGTPAPAWWGSPLRPMNFRFWASSPRLNPEESSPLHHNVQIYVFSYDGKFVIRGIAPSITRARHIVESAGLGEWLTRWYGFDIP